MKSYIYMVMMLSLVLIAGCNTTDQVNYDVVEGEALGHVIQLKGEVKNLGEIEDFYKNVLYKNEDEIQLVIEKNSTYHEYELRTEDGKIKLYSDVIRFESGHTEYKLKVYDSMKKTLKKGVINYILVNENEEFNLLSYKMS